MNKFEKYCWNQLKIKDTLFGAGYLLHQNWQQIKWLFFVALGFKNYRNKQEHNRIMHFMGIYK